MTQEKTTRPTEPSDNWWKREGLTREEAAQIEADFVANYPETPPEECARREALFVEEAIDAAIAAHETWPLRPKLAYPDNPEGWGSLYAKLDAKEQALNKRIKPLNKQIQPLEHKLHKLKLERRHVRIDRQLAS